MDDCGRWYSGWDFCAAAKRLEDGFVGHWRNGFAHCFDALLSFQRALGINTEKQSLKDAAEQAKGAVKEFAA